jgi:hypothetical protein
MIVVAYAVGAVVVLAALVADPASRATSFPLVVTAATVAIVGVLLLLQRRARLRRTVAEVRSAESVVASGLIEAPEVDVAELLGELRRLGFEMIAATDTTIGGGPPIRTWVLTESSGEATTWVEVGVARTPMAIFLSRAGDGRFLETTTTSDGATIDHPNLLARPIDTSVEDALRDHRATLAEWTSRAGPPIVVRTLEDYRRVETELRERTAGMRIAAYLERVVEPGLRRWAICAGIGVVTFLAVVLVPGILS